MQILEQALKAKVPVIYVTNNDLVHTQVVLSFIAGETVYPLNIGLDFDASSLKHSTYYTVQDITPDIYISFKDYNKCLVCVNTKPSVLYFEGGILLPPREMMLNYLKDLIDNSECAESILPSFSGMTLKEMYEAVKITKFRTNDTTYSGVTDTRKAYISKLKGISQIETAYDFYQCPSYLETWLDSNSSFFVKPINKILTPRGLLLDGVPGTGKTAASKYIANLWGLPLYHLDISSIKGKYVGDSEASLNAALAQVDAIAPCILIIDEVEKVFSAQNDSGVTSSLLSTLLWWLQEHESRVFTVMTTNSKESIPKELYREGRIDEVMVFRGIESAIEAVEFAKHYQTILMSKVGSSVVVSQELEKSYDLKLKTKITQLFSKTNAVAQVKIIKEVNSLVKLIISDSNKQVD